MKHTLKVEMNEKKIIPRSFSRGAGVDICLFVVFGFYSSNNERTISLLNKQLVV